MRLTNTLKAVGFFLAIFSFNTPALADAQAEVNAAMTSSDTVKVIQKRSWIGVSHFFGFKPKNPVSTRGLIIYPGAFVDPRNYAPIARHFADQGYYAAVVTPPFNFDFLGVQYATYVKNHWGEDKVTEWVIGGHSLGGVVAADYVSANRAAKDRVHSLFLLAAYTSPLTNLSNLNKPVTSIYGTVDGLTSIGDIENSKKKLPAHTKFVGIDGGNHTQFYYWDSLQNNDNPAQISREQQQAIVEQEIGLLLTM
ncbi:hypothetical protein Maes01_02009 [Microbulbifer aestuariivivens]|uniref:Alpha/beta hydrolase fold-5 domain-containing protein n=2 Tax=Microbulbifer aestuariivivens TaxID=1908308 RepID=A0ABP9WQF2_9GAMM